MCPYLREEYYEYLKIEEYCSTGLEMISVYCLGDGMYCPNRDGDDRYRRKDALTEEVSDQIIFGFKKSLENGGQKIYGLLSDVAQIVGATNYELLYDSFYAAGNRKINLSVSGCFRSVVKSGMEKRQADKLEGAMQKMIDFFEPADELPYISLESARLQISERDFDELDLLISQSVPAIMGSIEGENVCHIPQYNKITGEICRKLSDGIYSYLSDMKNGFYEVRDRFRKEVGYIGQNSERVLYGFNGGIPRW